MLCNKIDRPCGYIIERNKRFQHKIPIERRDLLGKIRKQHGKREMLQDEKQIEVAIAEMKSAMR